MHKDFIVPNKNNAEELYKPPKDSGILPSDWTQFVHQRITSEFKQMSEQQKERRSKHLYPHHLSRKGYANYTEEIKGKNKELHGDDDEIDRLKIWKKARLNKREQLIMKI